MSIEKPYVPSSEEVKKAEEMMMENEKRMSEEKEAKNLDAVGWDKIKTSREEIIKNINGLMEGDAIYLYFHDEKNKSFHQAPARLISSDENSITMSINEATFHGARGYKDNIITRTLPIGEIFRIEKRQ